MHVEYLQGSDLPDLEVDWYDTGGSLRDFSTGYSFQLAVKPIGGAAAFTKSTGIIGSKSSPNIRVQWANLELDLLSPGRYVVTITVTRLVDGKQHKGQGRLHILPAG